MTADLSGAGCLYVESSIARTDVLDEETYLKWYDEEHIPEILATGGIKSARRFKNVDPEADKPYLALYPMTDIGFMSTDKFKNISVKSGKLPDTGLVYDLADFDIRYDNLIQVYDPTGKGKGKKESGLV